MKYPPPSTHESWMNFFKLNPLLKGLADEMMARGVQNSYLFPLKGRTKGTSHQLQAPLDDQFWNEVKFNQLYKSLYVGSVKIPSIKNSLRTAWAISQTLGWSSTKEWCGCGLLTNAQTSFTAPQWHGASSPKKNPKRMRSRLRVLV